MSERRTLLQESLLAIERLQARLEAKERQQRQPIAIIGAGCRYPGDVETPDALWQMLHAGVDAVTEVPADRWDVNAYYDPDPKKPGKMITRRGGFLSQVDLFDTQFFGISPREAASMDPQQRLLLECSQEALESAGIPTDSLAGSLTGVFIGLTMSEWAQLLRRDGVEHSDVYAATGSVPNAAAGRIAFHYGLQGPCLSLDTACSSSLVALHMACQSLRVGECNFALAGGVNVILSPDAMVMFSKWGMMAPDGACKTFDAAADGFVRAEGCAVVALKRLSDAVAAGDPIMAVIRGSAVNSDGRSSGLTVPNGPAQQAVIRAALQSAQLSPTDIDYVEAHGTGTPLGDPIEVEALGAVLCEGRTPERPLRIGSIKTNIGHSEAASGIAGVLKVTMALRRQGIPAHLHFTRPNPSIAWGERPIEVPTRLMPWPRGQSPRRAGVSSFGFSGTNAHLILEEAPSELRGVLQNGPVPVLLSARDDAALRSQARRLADHVTCPDAPEIADIATTLATGRAHLPRRAAFLAASAADIERELRAIGAGMSTAPQGGVKVDEKPRIGFLFTGQGSQYTGMGRTLYRTEPVFRAVLDAAAKTVEPILERPLLEIMFEEDAGSELSRTAYTQPALFALEYALAQLWRSWGIEPSVVGGHSLGEYVAACVAGVFSFEQGLLLVAQRASLMQSLPGGGGMAAILTNELRVLERLTPYSGRLCIAAVNGPEETVVAGEAVALAALVEAMTAEGIASRTLDVSHAFHSHRLDPMLDALAAAAAAIPHALPRPILISNITGAPFDPGSGPDAAYWRRHARQPVRFADMPATLRKAGVTLLVEIGPHPTLLGLIGRAMPDAPWTAIGSLRRGCDERGEMLSAATALFVRGAHLDWKAILAERGGRRIPLPTYPFQRERYWTAPAAAAAIAVPASGHPLLGARRSLASLPGTTVWECELSLKSHPWIRDHRVQGAAILPATAYVEMALAAAGEVLGNGALSIRDIENIAPIVLHEDSVHRVQSTLVMDADGTARFSVHGQRPDKITQAGSPAWTTHVTARVGPLTEPSPQPEESWRPEAIRQRCSTQIEGQEFYAAWDRKGNRWGEQFQGMRQLWCGEGEALGRIEAVPGIISSDSLFRFHPALADACAHALVGTAPLAAANGPLGGALVGGGVGEIRFHSSPLTPVLWAHAKLRPAAGQPLNVLTGDIWVYDDNGVLVSESLNARLWFLNDQSREGSLGSQSDWYYHVAWRPQTQGVPGQRAPSRGTWLIFADRSGIAEWIAAARDEAGQTSVLVEMGDAWSVTDGRITMRADSSEDYERLLAAFGSPSVILHLWSLNAPGMGSVISDPQRAGAASGAESALMLLHAVRNSSHGGRPRLWFITANCQPVLKGDNCDSSWGAQLWGAGRSLSAEHPEMWGGLVDLPATVVVERDAGQLMREVEGATIEDKLALRGGQRYVPRLVRREVTEQQRSFSARADGTYLITGGLGGIGLVMAQWLVDRGARHLLLIGRTALPSREQWAQFGPDSAQGRRIAAIVKLEQSGAMVSTSPADVSDLGALRECLETYENSPAPAVCGLIHAAGVLQLEELESQSLASFRHGLSAKVAGAWNLQQLFGDRVLDLFVLCSSTSALLNSPMLGGYAAGNAFLDSLAHYRRAQGQSALSINWGTWGEVGMAADAAAELRDSSRIISNVRGLAALLDLLEGDDVQAAVAPIDWMRFAREYPSIASDPFLEDLIAGNGTAQQGAGSASLSRAALRELPPSSRRSAICDYLRIEAARVLGMVAERLEATTPISSYGFDSLMAVQLKNRIELDLGAVVQMIHFLRGPSVEQLAELIDAETDYAESGAEPTESAVAESWEEGSL